MPIEDGAVHRASLVVADEFQAATFNSLHGFYRVAADCLSEKNLTLYRVSQIRSGKLFDHYDELDHIFQVGEKIASFYLRDLVFIYGLDSLISKDELKFLQPIDVWVRKVAHRLGIISAENCPEDRVRSQIIEACAQAGVSTLKFNQGAWYLGKYAFDIVIEHLDKISFE